MTITTTRWVLWISLILIFPIPFFSAHFSLLPTGYLLRLFIESLLGPEPLLSAMSVGLIIQMLLALIETWLMAYLYTLWSRNWPSKIRGSIMGVSIFSLLIILSSLPVYDSLTDGSKFSFLKVYQ